MDAGWAPISIADWSRLQKLLKHEQLSSESDSIAQEKLFERLEELHYTYYKA